MSGSCHWRARAEVLLHVELRAEQALLFARPQADANRAARLGVDSFQNAHGFHHHDGSRSVVGGAGTGVPRVEMGADHHDFVFLVGAGNFGDGVVLHGVVVVEGVRDVQLDFDVLLLLEQASHSIPLFERDRDGRVYVVSPVFHEPPDCTKTVPPPRLP